MELAADSLLRLLVMAVPEVVFAPLTYCSLNNGVLSCICLSKCASGSFISTCFLLFFLEALLMLEALLCKPLGMANILSLRVQSVTAV